LKIDLEVINKIQLKRKKMKKFITITALMVGFSIFGQCKIKSEYDKFEKLTTYKSGVENILKGAKGFQIFIMKQTKENYLPTYYLYIMSDSKGCLTSESSMQFLTDKGEVIKLKYTGDINCGTSIPYFNADENVLNHIKESKITDIRIIYHEFYSGVELNEKLQLRLNTLLTCILDAKSETEQK
jgi:hypothetical protein